MNNWKINLLKDIFTNGDKITVRDQETIECMNYSFQCNPYDRFFNLKGRKFNLNYVKEELKWYLRANKYDLSILDHASIWKMLVNKDNSINSNYGDTIFNGPFENVVDTLKKDRFSRRAVIMIGNNENYMSDTNDYKCTLDMVFSIRKNKLDCYVRMRSNDAIFGLANDLPFFTFIQELLYNRLLEFYPDLEMGLYNHNAISIHIYKRHYKMVQRIIDNNEELKVECPKINGVKEAKWLTNKDKDINNIPEDFKFSKWLYE